MATPPTCQSVTQTAFNTTTSPKTTSSITVQSGDVLVAAAGTEGSTSVTISSSPTLTWTLQQSVAGGANNSDVQAWTATVPAGTSSITVTFTRSGSAQNYGGLVWVWRGSDGYDSSAQAFVTSGTTAPTGTLTTTTDNCGICCFDDDWNAGATTGYAWRTINSFTPSAADGTVAVATQVGTNYTVYSARYPDAGAAGAKTIGMTAPTQRYSLVGVAVKGTAASGATVNAVAATATAAAGTPVVAGAATVADTAATATAAAGTPVVSAGAKVVAVVATATGAAGTPTVTAGATVAGVRATATAAAGTPTPTTLVQPPAATATATAGTPTVTGNATVVAVAATATAAAGTPTVSGGGGTVTISQPDGSAGGYVYGDSFVDSIAQTFTPSQAMTVTQATAGLAKVNAPTDNWYLTIAPDNGSGAPGTVVGTSNNVASSSISTTLSDVTFTFTSGPTLTSGTVYWLILNRTGTASSINSVKWCFAGNVYSGGALYTESSGSWTASGQDAEFSVTGTVASGDRTVNPPAATATAAVNAPTLSVGATITEPAATATAAAGTPVVRGNATVQAVAATATGAAGTPTVSAVRNPTVQAVVATATATVNAPVVSSGGSVTIAAVAATATAQAYAPALRADVTVAAVCATATAASGVPTVTAGTGATVQAVRATATAAAGTPVVTIAVVVQAVVATATAAGRAPSFAASATALAVVAVASGAVPAPVVRSLVAAGQYLHPAADVDSGSAGATVGGSAGASLGGGSAGGKVGGSAAASIGSTTGGASIS